jgi:hypothetical protein
LSSVLPFWDKTWDKTPFVPLPKMAEFPAFLDAPKEPGDGFELSVPGGSKPADCPLALTLSMLSLDNFS